MTVYHVMCTFTCSIHNEDMYAFLKLLFQILVHTDDGEFITIEDCYVVWPEVSVCMISHKVSRFI